MKIIRYSDTINEATKTRGDITTLVVRIGDKTFFNKEASITFYEVIEFISKNVGIEKFIEDNIESSISGRKIIGLKPEDFPTYAKQGLKQSSGSKFIISTHSSTEVKKSILEYLLKFYNIEGTVEIRNRIERVDSEVNKSKESDKKYTFIEAAQIILKLNNNEPMSAVDIWSKISEKGLVDTKGKNPKGILLKTMSVYSDNSPVKDRKDKNIFTITQTSPIKFILINPNDEVQSVSDDYDDFDDDFDNIDKISDIIKKVERPVINPFGGESTKNSDRNTSAICVLGESGAGKTYRIEKTLEKEDHISEVIIPSSSTTNLLVQYTKGVYVLSRLGKLILKANSDKSHYYTVVFDECHKYIEMINDELLQCISTKRNDGLRFISLDPVTDELFSELPEKNGRRLISDNLGFIFISSKEAIIRDNSDFYNRVDIITIDKSDRDIEFAIELLKNKIESREDEEYSME
jgi:hypothetical protein